MDPKALEKDILSQIEAANDDHALESVRLGTFGKKGKLTEAMKGLGKVAPEQRKEMGQAFNTVKNTLMAALEEKKANLNTEKIEKMVSNQWVDVTLTPPMAERGTLHPLTRAKMDILRIFEGMGFQMVEGPDIEDDWHNFTALNFPPGHPAREEHDTFFLPPHKEGEERMVLRTHTSSGQIRTMTREKPPYKIVSIGRVYRSDYDMTHTPMFHQMEALYVAKGIHMGHLKGCLQEFVVAFFEVEDVPVRFRPSFFPFTEPSAEVDIGYTKRPDGSIKIGRATKGEDQFWMEILGSGMVHPNVLKNCNVDPEEYQGFAFGLGLERAAMIKYGIPDLRAFFDGDMRWHQHYGSPFAI